MSQEVLMAKEKLFALPLQHAFIWWNFSLLGPVCTWRTLTGVKLNNS